MQFRWYSIGTYFQNKKNIATFNEFVLFTGVTSLGAAFHGCYLTELTLPSTIVTIGNNCFTDAHVEELVMPAGVTSIGNLAINTTYNKKVTLLGTTPPSMGTYNFASYRTYYVPASALETYRTANVWSSYAQYIQPIPQ